MVVPKDEQLQSSSQNILHFGLDFFTSILFNDPIMKKGKRTEKEKIAAALRSSYWYESAMARMEIKEGIVSGFRQRGLDQYNLKQRDSADFIYSDPQARIQFAVESGLIPSTDL